MNMHVIDFFKEILHLVKIEKKKKIFVDSAKIFHASMNERNLQEVE